MIRFLEVLEIPRQRYDAQAGKLELDPVTVFLEDFEPGRGQLTLVCWGRAWTHYWGAMGNGATLREFLTSASSGYIVGKLMLTRDMLLRRAEPREERWLSQMVEALKAQISASPAPRLPLTQAAADVLAERRRQVEVEGWTPEHDDAHGDNSMSIAAACYALEGTGPAKARTVEVGRLWQWAGWEAHWWKPRTRRQNLIRAAALLLAEIERLDRAAASEVKA